MSVTTSAQQIIRGASARHEGLPPELWTLVDRYRPELLNQAYVLLGNLAEAEEVAQETFCAAYRRREQLGDLESLGAWLRAINRAQALNRRRGRRRSERRERESAVPEAVTGGFKALELREAVARAIEALPETLRPALLLHYWEDLGAEEIAGRLGVSSRTVHRQLKEAGLLLFERLGALAGAERENGEESCR